MHRAWNVCESIIGGVRDGKILKIVDGIGGVACILGCIRPILHKYEVWVEVVERFLRIVQHAGCILGMCI